MRPDSDLMDDNIIDRVSTCLEVKSNESASQEHYTTPTRCGKRQQRTNRTKKRYLCLMTA